MHMWTCGIVGKLEGLLSVRMFVQRSAFSSVVALSMVGIIPLPPCTSPKIGPACTIIARVGRWACRRHVEFAFIHRRSFIVHLRTNAMIPDASVFHDNFDY